MESKKKKNGPSWKQAVHCEGVRLSRRGWNNCKKYFVSGRGKPKLQSGCANWKKTIRIWLRTNNMVLVVFNSGGSIESCSSSKEAREAETLFMTSTKTKEVSKKHSDLLLPFLASASEQLPYTGLLQHRGMCCGRSPASLLKIHRLQDQCSSWLPLNLNTQTTECINEHAKKYWSVEYLSAASVQSFYRSHTEKPLKSFSTILLLPRMLASFLTYSSLKI